MATIPAATIPAATIPAGGQGRHHGLDWLRIGAFGLLILYHIGMVFVAWDFHIKSALPVRWIEWPMLAVNPWRMSLLFVVSGYATRHLLARARGGGGFLGPRLRRLGLPLLFGIAVIVPPQPWVELMVKHGYAGGFLHFWTADYFRFGTLHDIVLPTWNHLWFVLYLLVYTMLVAGIAALRPPALQPAFDRAFAGWRLWLLPVGYYLLLKLSGGADNKTLLFDGYGHALYLPAFLFGLGLAGNAEIPSRFAAHWRALLALAAAAWLARMLFNMAFADVDEADIAPWLLAAAQLLRPLQSWGAIAGLIGLATRHWNHDHRWRAPLTRAVFPWYMVHQTVIVVAAFALRPLGWSNGAQFVAILAATLLGCWLAAVLARLPGGEWLGGSPARRRISPA